MPAFWIKPKTSPRAGKIRKPRAKSLLHQASLATRADNPVVNSVAGNKPTYDADAGVLSAKDVAAANRTRSSVASYKPSVRSVARTSHGRAAISTGGRASGTTSAAQGRNSAARLGAVNDANVESVKVQIGTPDITTPT